MGLRQVGCFFPQCFQQLPNRAYWKSPRSKARICLIVLRCTCMKDVKKREINLGRGGAGHCEERKAHITQKSLIKFTGQICGCSQKFDLEL